MDIQELQEVCRQVRRDIIIMTNKAGAGHPGGSLSATEALVALYFDVMKGIDPKDDKNPNRDRFVLSKGHAAPALYGTLCERGYFGREEFDHFRQLHGILQGHPDVKKCPGVDASTGSLGQGISIAVGMALVSFHTLKPFDDELDRTYAAKCGKVFTVEEHSIIGGLGDAVASSICGMGLKHFEKIGINDVFGQSGKPAALLEEYGLTGKQIADRIAKA